MFSQVKDLAVYLFPSEKEMETALDAFFFFTSFHVSGFGADVMNAW
jgi:hypothetical protein